MTLDHSSDFDARRVGRWQRRAAVRRIRRATDLTAADRELRVQQARAAQTRGELNALTRGLGGTPVVSAASRTPMGGPAAPQSRSQDSPPTPQPPARRRSVSRKLVIGLVVLVVTCGGSVVSCVSSLVDSSSDSGSDSSDGPSSGPPDLATRAGLVDMLDALDDDAGGDPVLLIVERRSAELWANSGATSSVRYRYDGDVTRGDEVPRTWSEPPLDLDEIDVDVVQAAVHQARRSSRVLDVDARVQITGDAAGPRTLVSFPDSSRPTYSLFVDHDGEVVYETD